MAENADEILRVEDLHVAVGQSKSGTAGEILRGVSLSIETGSMTGLVGESGSGKSMTARAVMRQLPSNVTVTHGRVMLNQRDLLELPVDLMRTIRGAQIAMVFQNPKTALHPMLSVERQMGEVAKSHSDVGGSERGDLVREYLELCGIPDSARVARAYPHELSGGLAQRVVIAMALLPRPELLIADEPTTSLDATVQRQILELIRDLQQRLHLSVLMITHDLGIVAHFCDRAVVMSRGLVVEQGSRDQILTEPSADYTKRLVAASRLETLEEEPRQPTPQMP
jgi:ABC-type glutathione transport system ATPase component